MQKHTIQDAQKWVEIHEMLTEEHDRWRIAATHAQACADDTKGAIRALEDSIADWAIEYLADGFFYSHLCIQLQAVEAGKEWTEAHLRNLVRRRREALAREKALARHADT